MLSCSFLLCSFQEKYTDKKIYMHKDIYYGFNANCFTSLKRKKSQLSKRHCTSVKNEKPNNFANQNLLPYKIQQYNNNVNINRTLMYISGYCKNVRLKFTNSSYSSILYFPLHFNINIKYQIPC